MPSIGTLTIDLVAGTARLQADFKKAGAATRKFKRDLVKLGKVAGTAAVIGFAAFSTAAIKAAADAAETNAKFATVFGTAKKEMDSFIAGLKKSVPATTEELEGFSASLQDLLVPIGIIPKEAVKMNKSFIALAADLASFNNVPMKQALAAIRSGLVGASEPLQAFGVDTRVAALEVKALELGLIKEGDVLDNQTRAMALLAQVTDQSSFAIGDAARTANSAANQMKFLSRNLKEITEVAGAAMIPTFTVVVQQLVKMTTGAEDGAGAFVFLAEAVAFPLRFFFAFGEGINRFIVLPLLKGNLLLKEAELAYQKFGGIIGIATKGAVENLGLEIMQINEQIANATAEAGEWASAQADLIDRINQFKATLKQTNAPVEEFVLGQQAAADKVSQAASKVSMLTKENATLAGSLKGLDQIMSGKVTPSSIQLARSITIAGTKVGDTTTAADRFADSMEALDRELRTNADEAKAWSSQVSTQISTVFNDLSQGFADSLIGWKGMWSSFASIAKSFASSILRTTFESLFNPLLKGFQGFLGGKGFDFSSAFGGFGGLAGSLGGLFGSTGSATAAGSSAFVGPLLPTIGTAGITAGVGGGGLLSSILGFATGPVGLSIIGIGLALPFLIKAFRKDPIKSASKEALRDFGINIPKNAIKDFLPSLGLNKDTFKGIRKDIESSPQFLKSVLIPEARRSGQLDQLVASFRNLQAFGKTFDFSAAVTDAIAGNFGAFNEQFKDVFGQSVRLRDQFGDLSRLLVPGAGDEGTEDPSGSSPGVRTGELLGDVFVDRLDTLITTFGEGFDNLIEKLNELITGGASGTAITINAIDSATFREFLAGDGGDAFMQELLLRRQEQMLEIVESGKKGVTE